VEEKSKQNMMILVNQRSFYSRRDISQPEPNSILFSYERSEAVFLVVIKASLRGNQLNSRADFFPEYASYQQFMIKRKKNARHSEGR